MGALGDEDVGVARRVQAATFTSNVMMVDSSRQIVGEMDDVRWFPAAIGPVVAADDLAEVYTAFQCGNRSEPWALFLMRTRP